MRIHHLNCGTLNLGGAHFVCNVLLVEASDGLVLIDTGFGVGDIARPARLGEQFLQNARPKLDPAETAVAQIKSLGHRPEDVRHILMTHLDRDHAGGVGDFPGAFVHAHDDELRCALDGAPGVRVGRYVSEQWSPDTKWRRYEPTSETWFGGARMRARIDGLDIVVIPTPGHTPGHCAIAVETGSGWLVHAGDTHYHHLQRRLPPQSPSAALDAFQKSTDSDTPAREASQLSICRLAAEHADIDVVCTHDPFDFERFVG